MQTSKSALCKLQLVRRASVSERDQPGHRTKVLFQLLVTVWKYKKLYNGNRGAHTVNKNFKYSESHFVTSVEQTKGWTWRRKASSKTMKNTSKKICSQFKFYSAFIIQSSFCSCATSVHSPPHIKCQLCCKRYKEPRILPCLHSFCEQCLHKEIERSGTKQNMQCPICQRSITIPEGGVNAIPHLGFEVEVAGYMSKIGSDGEKSCDACIEGCTGPAVVFCCTCAHFLCKLCHDKHKRYKILYHHQIVGLDHESLKLLPSIMESITKRLCSQPDHEKEELQFYCETCQLLVCRDCTSFFTKTTGLMRCAILQRSIKMP